MHRHDAAAEELTAAIVRYAVSRVRMDPPPLDGPRTPEELSAEVGATITSAGIGGDEALRRFVEILAPACISVDHPRFLSFVPAAPTEAAVLFDLVVGASSIYAGSWLEGAGAVHAENEALGWIAELAGMPPTAGGVFVSGGTAGNLSALVAARWAWRTRHPGRFDRVRGVIVTSSGAHSSVAQAARAMDADVIAAPADAQGRFTEASLDAALGSVDESDRERVFALVATAGTTNAGVIDDLAAAASRCERHDWWFHVDGAYGAAALVAPSVRDRFDGIERADSLIVDPHKWLFAPFDCCALVYRDPSIARAAHTQHAEYLEVLQDHDGGSQPWNPSDFAHHLSRRARGLPLWFSLAVHGTDAYRDAVEHTLDVTRQAAALIDETDHLERVADPELSVVLFRRVGWTPADYQAWSDAQLRGQHAFVVPTVWQDETVLRICIVNPLTTTGDIASIIASLR